MTARPISKGDIVVGATGFAARVRRIKYRDDAPNLIILESLTVKDKDGGPLELDGRWTDSDFKAGRIRRKGD
jgi:hypothetical protein